MKDLYRIRQCVMDRNSNITLFKIYHKRQNPVTYGYSAIICLHHYANGGSGLACRKDFREIKINV